MTPVFADPRTDFVFQRIFGSEDHTTALIGFLNHVLRLDESHRVQSVSFLPPEQRPKVAELKRSIVDVKCIDARGTKYVVEMQVLNVEAFEKRVVFNVAKAYTNQLGPGAAYPELNDVVGVSICDFELWPKSDGSTVPMLSLWRLQEQESGTVGLQSLSFVFLELPKYSAGDNPQNPVDKWAYFFREAHNLTVIPPALQESPFQEALEAARTAGFTLAEWDSYIAAGMAIQDERGALSLAEKTGEATGEARGMREAIRGVCDVLEIPLSAGQEERLERLPLAALKALMHDIRRLRRWPPDDRH
jgi:predicted transposase/invertase (TIGR01784 family)